MATKTKAAKSTVAVLTAIQDTLDSIEANTKCLAGDLALAEQTARYLQDKEAQLSRAASTLRNLLEAQKHRRSPSRRPGSKPAKRGDVDGARPRVSQLRARTSNVGSRKRLPRKSALQVCTCTGSCRGAERLGKGWVCALKDIEKALPY